ncbi:Flp family type IVb pilin [Zavarzinia sp.]|uniref:Flp family type IVb pilin n=1 Tax=Zavarzinia sp. TaxID=2027920 RepID=UPI003BB5F0D0
MLRTLITSMRKTDERGATAIEYALIAALIAVAAIVAMGFVGDGISNVFTNVADTLNDAT